MGHPAVGDDFVTERAFGAEGQLVFGRLAVDEESRAARVLRHVYAPTLLRSSPTTNSSPKLRSPLEQPSAAWIIAAMMPLVSQAPRPQMYSSSSREAKKGGTVSMWVERVTAGVAEWAKTLKRRASTSMRSTVPSYRGRGR